MTVSAQPVRLRATPRAIAMLTRLARTHGPLAIFQSGGCCDGSLPLCLLAGELPPSPNDMLLGHVAGVPFYIDAYQYTRWGEPAFLLDTAGGAPEGFSLGEVNAHLISAPLAGGARPAGAA